jgi:hypothetical protein
MQVIKYYTKLNKEEKGNAKRNISNPFIFPIIHAMISFSFSFDDQFFPILKKKIDKRKALINIAVATIDQNGNAFQINIISQSQGQTPPCSL